MNRGERIVPARCPPDYSVRLLRGTGGGIFTEHCRRSRAGISAVHKHHWNVKGAPTLQDLFAVDDVEIAVIICKVFHLSTPVMRIFPRFTHSNVSSYQTPRSSGYDRTTAGHPVGYQ